MVTYIHNITMALRLGNGLCMVAMTSFCHPLVLVAEGNSDAVKEFLVCFVLKMRNDINITHTTDFVR